MKKLFFLAYLLSSFLSINSQNTFPADGKVGIGTDSPSQELQIVTQEEGLNYLMHLGGNSYKSGNAFGIGFNPEGYHTGYYERIKTAIVVEGNNTGWGRGNLHILQNNVQDMAAATLDDAVFTVSSKGNVGIGTTDANSLLTIAYDNGSDQIALKRDDGLEAFTININDSNQVVFKTKSGSGDYDFQTNVAGKGVKSVFFIEGIDGSVGIGTTNTEGYKLAVAGTTGIIAEKVTVKIQSQWPDYVFNTNYNLPTLEEVEKHIEEKGHLQNIPSAKEMEESDGIDLGKMNTKLLQKIEELTLYTIQQEKEIKALKEQFSKFESLLKEKK